MGTPEFAVASLDKLYQEGYDIAGVVTAPDRPAGRGLKLSESAVKKFAVLHNLKILQPLKLKDAGFLNELSSLKADLHLVVAFRMLPEVVWNMPKHGTLNLHGSLLPQYRGAAPINWAIINGESTTGVTIFKLKHEIDTGNILQQESIQIGPNETAGELHDRMKEIGARLLTKTVYELLNNGLPEIVQEDINSTHTILKQAPKIFTPTCTIQWDRSISEIYNLIRGLSPYPGAFTMLDDKKLKIFKSIKEESESLSLPAGSIYTDGKNYLKFSCLNGFISAEEVQLEGKKKMHVREFLKGYKINTK